MFLFKFRTTSHDTCGSDSPLCKGNGRGPFFSGGAYTDKMADRHPVGFEPTSPLPGGSAQLSYGTPLRHIHCQSSYTSNIYHLPAKVNTSIVTILLVLVRHQYDADDPVVGHFVVYVLSHFHHFLNVRIVIGTEVHHDIRQHVVLLEPQ